MKLDPHRQLGRVALFSLLSWQNLFLDHGELSLETVAVLERFAIEYSLLNVRNVVKSKFLRVEPRDPHQCTVTQFSSKYCSFAVLGSVGYYMVQY